MRIFYGDENNIVNKDSIFTIIGGFLIDDKKEILLDNNLNIIRKKYGISDKARTEIKFKYLKKCGLQTLPGYYSEIVSSLNDIVFWAFAYRNEKYALKDRYDDAFAYLLNNNLADKIIFDTIPNQQISIFLLDKYKDTLTIIDDSHKYNLIQVADLLGGVVGSFKNNTDYKNEKHRNNIDNFAKIVLSNFKIKNVLDSNRNWKIIDR